ncbi:MAG: hypothetical protein ACRC7N_22315 [Clostridium sp.]
MTILVKYIEDGEELIAEFNCYEALGIWIANRYDIVRVLDVGIEEEF